MLDSGSKPIYSLQSIAAPAYRVLIMNSLHFVKRYFYHENTKSFLALIRALVTSCFRDWSLLVPAYPG